MKYCPVCHAEMEDSAKFCLVCGRALPVTEKIDEEPAPEEAAAPAPETEPEAPAAPEEETAKETAPASEKEPAAPEEEATEEKPDGEEEQEEPAAPEKKPGTLSTTEYFLLEALYALPVIGTVFLFIFSLGRNKNDSLRNFAASVLIWRLIFYILLFAALAFLLINFKTWGPKVLKYLNSVSTVIGH